MPVGALVNDGEIPSSFCPGKPRIVSEYFRLFCMIPPAFIQKKQQQKSTAVSNEFNNNTQSSHTTSSDFSPLLASHRWILSLTWLTGPHLRLPGNALFAYHTLVGYVVLAFLSKLQWQGLTMLVLPFLTFPPRPRQHPMACRLPCSAKTLSVVVSWLGQPLIYHRRGRTMTTRSDR